MRDTLDKIVKVYFSSLCKNEFKYKGKNYKPKKVIRVSPNIFRSATCPENCGACCYQFSLDYLPVEKIPFDCIERQVEINNKFFKIFSIVQENKNEHFCGKLNKENGRCSIHANNPFSCDFELIRFLISENKVNILTRLYGRGWNMLRSVDNCRGALCKIIETNEQSIEYTIKKLNRLKIWLEYFKIDSYIDNIIKWACDKDRRRNLLVITEGKENLEEKIF